MARRIVMGAAAVALVLAGAACAPDTRLPRPRQSGTTTSAPINGNEPPSNPPPPATVSITTTIPPAKH
jgi:hypothetical protein